jgi:hypothetical protein
LNPIGIAALLIMSSPMIVGKLVPDIGVNVLVYEKKK